MLRLFSFRPYRAGDSADDLLRRQILPAMNALPGLRYVYAARASAAETDQRVLVSVWDDRATPSEFDLRQPFEFESSDHAVDIEVELRELAVELAFADAGAPQILRIFRGRSVTGQLDKYIDQARSGTIADAVSGHGPEALFLARITPDEFVTVSTWSAWDRIAASTGGNIRQPVNTRHTELLESGTAVFYEIVPNTPHGRVGGPGSDGHGADAAGASHGQPDTTDLLIALPEQSVVSPGS